MALSTKISVRISATQTSAGDLATAQDPLTYLKEFTWASGTGADQADLIFHDQRTLNASANEELDLAASLTDKLGNTLTFVEIMAIMVFAAAANTNNVQVGGSAANGFVNWVANATDIINVRPGGMLLLIARDATGYAVTAGTGDLLKLTNSGAGTSVTYDIILIGRSA